MTNSPILGYKAIELAETIPGVVLGKYSDPTETGKIGITIEKAREIAAVNPSLVFAWGTGCGK